MERLKLLPDSSIQTLIKSSSAFNPQTSLETSLRTIFSQEIEESKLSGTKRRLGETAKNLTDEQIECMVTDFQYLIDTWLDEFEQDVFEGKTLKKLLGEKEYANNKQK